MPCAFPNVFDSVHGYSGLAYELIHLAPALCVCALSLPLWSKMFHVNGHGCLSARFVLSDTSAIRACMLASDCDVVQMILTGVTRHLCLCLMLCNVLCVFDLFHGFQDDVVRKWISACDLFDMAAHQNGTGHVWIYIFVQDGAGRWAWMLLRTRRLEVFRCRERTCQKCIWSKQWCLWSTLVCLKCTCKDQQTVLTGMLRYVSLDSALCSIA